MDKRTSREQCCPVWVINSFRKKNVMQTYDALIGHAYLVRRALRIIYVRYYNI